MVKRCIALLLAAVLLLAGCAVQESTETTDGRKLIGICLPDLRWEAEAVLLTEPLNAAGYRVNLEYANGDPEVQQLQLHSLLSRGADCLIICAVDAMALTEPLQQARESGVPVLAYDRMLMHTDSVSACVTTDTYTAGKQLGQYIAEHLEEPATVEFLMGSPEDNNAYLFHTGLMSVLQPHLENEKLTARSGRTKFEDTCVQNADPHTARSYLLDYSLFYYHDKLPDIVCTGGIGMAQQCADVFPEDGSDVPLLVGIGEKNSREPLNAYVCFDRETLAQTAAQWAQILLENPEALPRETTQNNGILDVPTYLQEPIIVK